MANATMMASMNITYAKAPEPVRYKPGSTVMVRFSMKPGLREFAGDYGPVISTRTSYGSRWYAVRLQDGSVCHFQAKELIPVR